MQAFNAFDECEAERDTLCAIVVQDSLLISKKEQLIAEWQDVAAARYEISNSKDVQIGLLQDNIGDLRKEEKILKKKNTANVLITVFCTAVPSAVLGGVLGYKLGR